MKFREDNCCILTEKYLSMFGSALKCTKLCRRLSGHKIRTLISTPLSFKYRRECTDTNRNPKKHLSMDSVWQHKIICIIITDIKHSEPSTKPGQTALKTVTMRSRHSHESLQNHAKELTEKTHEPFIKTPMHNCCTNGFLSTRQIIRRPVTVSDPAATLESTRPPNLFRPCYICTAVLRGWMHWYTRNPDAWAHAKQ